VNYRAAALAPSFSVEFKQFLWTFIYLTLAQRKDILTFTRVRVPLQHGSTLIKRMKCIDQVITISVLMSLYNDQPYQYVTLPFFTYLKTHEKYFLDHSSSSIISAYVRVCPPSSAEDFQQNLDDSLITEIRSAILPRPTSVRFSFDCLFSSDPKSRSIPLSNRLPPMELTSIGVHDTFVRAIGTIQSRVFYPELGRKTVGRECAENLIAQYPYIYDTPFLSDAHTQLDLDYSSITPTSSEKFYIRSGWRSDGPVEVRQAWKYTDLKPRTYYARGGTVLHTSRYIQEIVNILVDAFPETHRKNRFLTPNSVPSPDHTVIVYDYSSFTSCLNELPAFVDALGRFFMGVSIRVFDTREGIVTCDLGEMIHDYNQACNVYPEFVAKEGLGLEGRFRHHCGMLGVPGNIFLATLLHGIHTRFVAGVDRSKCVGDDALIHHISHPDTYDDDIEYAYHLIESLGNISRDKLVLFPFGGDTQIHAYQYLKRPIIRVDDILVQDDSLILPRIDVAFDIQDDFHVPQIRDRPSEALIFSQIRRMITSIKYLRISEFENSKRNPVFALISYLIQKIRKSDPSGKYGLRRSQGHPYALPPSYLWGTITFEEWLKEDLGYSELITVPKRCWEDPDLDYQNIYPGLVFEAPSNPKLNLLRKLGYVESSDLYEDISLESCGGYFDSYFSHPLYRRVFEYTIIKDVPSIYSQA